VPALVLQVASLCPATSEGRWSQLLPRTFSCHPYRFGAVGTIVRAAPFILGQLSRTRLAGRDGKQR